MSGRAVGWLCLVVVIVALVITKWNTARAQTTPRYYDEQLLNYRVTEFCAKTTNPPVYEAVVAIFQALPPLKPLGEWLDAFTTECRRKCGDA